MLDEPGSAWKSEAGAGAPEGPTRRAAAEAAVAHAEPPLWIALSMPTPTKILAPRRSAPAPYLSSNT